MSKFNPNFRERAILDGFGKRGSVAPAKGTELQFPCPHPGCTQVIQPFRHPETFFPAMNRVVEQEVLCFPPEDPYDNTIEHSSNIRRPFVGE